MSNYHILNSSEKDHEVNVVFHIPVPNENNAVGVNLRAALTQHKPFTESAVPWLAATNPDEVTSLTNGEIYEHSQLVEYDAKMTDVQKRSRIDEKYSALGVIVVNRIRSILKYWGLNRDVP